MLLLSHMRLCTCMYWFCFRYLSPLSAAPLVALVGFGLYELGFPSVRFDNCVCIKYSFKDMAYAWTINTQVAKCVEIGLPELILLVIFAMVWLDFYTGDCLLVLFVSSNCNFAFCSIFAVPATHCAHAEVYLRPVCCPVHYSHCVALRISSHCWRSIQKCTTKDSIPLPHWPFWINWWCTLVLFAFLSTTFHFLTMLAVKMCVSSQLFHKWNDRIRVPYPFQWGAPTFDAGEAFAMMAASFVALVEVWLHVHRRIKFSSTLLQYVGFVWWYNNSFT